jgi:hypothetical protein
MCGLSRQRTRQEPVGCRTINFAVCAHIRAPEATFFTLKTTKPTSLEMGFPLTPLRVMFDGRIIFDGFTTAKNLVIG